MKFLADIEVEEGLKDSSGDLGSNGQILSSTGTGTNWIAASGGGGIAGGITATQVAFGATTTDEIAGSAEATFLESVGKTLLQVGSTGGKAQTLININQANNSTSRARLELSKNALTRGFLGIENDSTDVVLYSNVNLVLDSDGDDVIITTQTASNVGVGNTSPTEKLDEVCDNYLEGRCRYGEECRRQHVGDALTREGQGSGTSQPLGEHSYKI